jgi:tRNA G18 (ribose-2'-O)-methylase SpoU
MPIVHVESPNDDRLAAYRSLKATNATRWSGQFVAEGEKLVRRLLASDFGVCSLLVAEQYARSFAQIVPADVDLLVVPDDWVENIVGFNFHRGVLACAQRKAPVDLAALCRAKPGRLTLVVCPDVRDPENLGAILRIASAFGVDAVVLGRECADPFSRRVLRVSMGAAFELAIVEADDLEGQLAAVQKESGVRLWAAVTDPAAAPFDRGDRPHRLALLLGSEGHGLAPAWIERCEQAITIPMRPGVDSLNVALAAGILLYHFTR